MILVTGAAGKTGLSVVRALSRRGAQVRAFVRNAEQAQRVRAAGVGEALLGDFENQADLTMAVQGAAAVYHICPNMHPAEVEIGRRIITACLDQNVERFVYHSVFHPQVEAMPHHWNKLRVEEILIGSGLPFTILQPTAYMQNVLARLAEVRMEGIYRIPYRVDTRISMVDLEDVAECAARVLVAPGYLGATFELVGPGLLSQEEIAAELSKVLGQDVRAEEIPLPDWKRAAQEAGLRSYAVETLINMFSYYDRFNFMGNSMVLGTLLGRNPTTFEDFLAREIHQI